MAQELEILPAALIAEGDKLYINGDFEKALVMYDLVLSEDADNISSLVARSRCYTRLGKLELALKDAEKVLKKDKKCQEALYQKAETLYQLGRYEHALVYYHRGHKLRPELDHFRIGIQKSQDAILGHLQMCNLKILKRTGFEKDRLFLKQIQRTELKTQIAQSSNEVKNLAEQGLEYLTKKTAACKEVRVNRLQKKP